MKNKVLLYRVKEDYSVFYDENTKEYVKLIHINKGTSFSFGYVLLFLIVLYSPKIFNPYYQMISSKLINILFLLISLFLSYIFSEKYLKYFYTMKDQSFRYIDKYYVHQNLSLGKKQFKRETFAFVISLMFSILLTIVFFANSNLYIYTVCFMCYFLTFMYINLNPIKRKKILNGDN